MSRRCNLALKVNRESETSGKPNNAIILKAGVALVYQGFEKRGKRGFTTRDWPGYDLRHYIREMKNRGIGIDHAWEKNGLGGQHKRWWLRDGHSSEEIAYPKKKKASAAATAKLSCPIKSNSTLGGK